MQLQSLVAVDIGNSRLKLGRFDRESGLHAGLPEPVETLAIPLAERRAEFDVAGLADWLSEHVAPGTPIVIGSVSKPATTALVEFLDEFDDGAWNNVRQLAGGDFALENRTQQPERVGIDRLAAALAAGAIRRADTPAIVIDFGTAITVDLLSAEGAFQGGAILPGVGTSAEALHARTDALPAVYVPMEGKSPPAVGTDTASAIHAGLYWGAVGAVRELIARQRDSLVAPPQVFVTGSTSPDMARLLGAPDYTVRYLPHLVLAGLALAAG
ncbi:type III pantothenate kinase [Aeoliella sp. ICT_H6.2]|uniref:Type III pantothenate kinase n=1 Tax=Aeoliella straminimaris TaxID=2954799 RepID=A0A9X2JJH3_9BACT|nr:type III pantothenate kinase [Aeoliella straminimaris]MCO6044984.1 type III pantothenate kinase [Aeoliella straminimaris]